MRKYTWLYAIVAATIFMGLLLSTITQKNVQRQEIDYVALNEIAKQAALHWQSPEQLLLFGTPYRYTVIANDGAIRFSSGEGLPDSVPAAVMSGFIPMDITIGTTLVGKALIYPSPSGSDTVTEMEARARIAGAIFTAFGLLAALNLAFLLVIHNALVKPFKRLQSFAHKITTGRLDEPLPMDRGNIFGLFTQSFDVMRESLLEARRNQLQAERAKKELIASLNHDVKTPVTSIRLISELLQAGTTEAATMDKLKTIETKADQIDRLMNDMMHSALEELGELKVVVTSEDSRVLRELFVEADDLSKVCVGDIPICLLDFDHMRMEQIIGNIITNSYKYAGTKIDVNFAVHNELLQIDVNDYGDGVDPDELELIATKFYRGANATASHKEGEGLGLYIAKLLMVKMGGALEAFNRDDGFTIRLLLRLSH